MWTERLGQSSYRATPVVEEILRLAQFHIVVDAHDRVIGGELKRKGEYERFVTWALLKLLQSGQTFVDVGANVGYFSLLAATRVGPTGRVLAVEPMPENWALLEKSIALNGFGNIIELHKVAAGDTTRRVRMTLGDRANSGSFSFVSGRQPSKDIFEVECRRLDDLLTGRRVDIIKMDIEGAEGLALKGMRQTLGASRPLLLMEYTPSSLESISGISGEMLLGFFDELSYAFQDVNSFEGRFRPQSRGELSTLLERRQSGHLDLLLFPRERAARC